MKEIIYILLANLNQYTLTNDSKLLLCSLYKEYLNRRKHGINKREAIFFKNIGYIYDNIMPKWYYEDINETCRELERAYLINCCYSDDDIAYESE